MAEASTDVTWRRGVATNPIGNGKRHTLDYASSESDTEEVRDVLVGLKGGGGVKELARDCTRTYSSTCTCSGTPLWQPPSDPAAINMLDVPWVEYYNFVLIIKCLIAGNSRLTTYAPIVNSSFFSGDSYCTQIIAKVSVSLYFLYCATIYCQLQQYMYGGFNMLYII